MSRFANIDSAEDALTVAGLPKQDVDRLMSHAQDALLMVRQVSVDAQVPVGASKFGGAPDLAPGTPWPMRPAYGDLTAMLAESAIAYGPDGYVPNAPLLEFFAAHWAAPAPLHFMAQIDLAEMAQIGPFDIGLPPEGRLLVFLDIASYSSGATAFDDGWIQVIHDTTPVADLVNHPLPDALRTLQNTHSQVESVYPHPNLDFSQCERLTAVPITSLPLEVMRYPVPVVQALDEMDLQDMTHLMGAGPEGPSMFGDQLGGHPAAIQTDVFNDLYTAAQARLRPVTLGEQAGDWDPNRWTHLLSIAGESYNPAFPSSWGDGDLYIAHRPDPARPAELGQIWAISQQS